MEQPPTYAWRCGSSPWRDYKYNKSTPERWRRRYGFRNRWLNQVHVCLLMVLAFFDEVEMKRAHVLVYNQAVLHDHWELNFLIKDTFEIW